jgi:2-oxoglutarate ferredoxin oxidoreductase subunit alpha
LSVLSEKETWEIMSKQLLMTGNEASGEAAIRAGCRFFYGYPITPQNEFFEYMAKRLPEVGGVFLQSESELAGINMVYGTAAAGKRVITASSACGMALMQEGISYLAASQLPCVLVDITRAGPGLGRIASAQSDYRQATRGGGDGDYRVLVLGPASAQEMADLTFDAFDLADKYRNPVMILTDGMLGQMMEPVALPPQRDLRSLPPKPWALTGAKNRERNLVLAAPYTDDELIALNRELKEKYRLIETTEQRWESLSLDDAELVIVAFGSTSRIALDAIETAQKEGIQVGMIRPITLWPFPTRAFEGLEKQVLAYLVIEMSNGQMLEDVTCTLPRDKPVYHFGQGGGWRPSPKSIHRRIMEIWKEGY